MTVHPPYLSAQQSRPESSHLPVPSVSTVGQLLTSPHHLKGQGSRVSLDFVLGLFYSPLPSSIHWEYLTLLLNAECQFQNHCHSRNQTLLCRFWFLESFASNHSLVISAKCQRLHLWELYPSSYHTSTDKNRHSSNEQGELRGNYDIQNHYPNVHINVWISVTHLPVAYKCARMLGCRAVSQPPHIQAGYFS